MGDQWRPTTANLRPGTLVLYDYLLRRFLLPVFATVPLGRLDTMTVRAWLAGLHRDGEVTPTKIAKAYRLLRRILNVAVEPATCRATRARSRAPAPSGRRRCATQASRSITSSPRRCRHATGR